MAGRLAPYGFLLAQLLLFYRKVLFEPSRFVIPWDLRYYHLPLADLMAKAFRAGELPLWDPYTYCGMPVYGNLTMALFYPPMMVTVALSNGIDGGRHLLYFLELQLLAHILLGSIFAYRLLRKLEVGAPAAVIGATVFELGPFFTSQTQHLGAVSAAAWMPLALHATIFLAERFNWRRVALLALALSMSFLAGFPAVTAVVFGGCGILVVTLVLLRRAHWRLLAVCAGACIWAGALSAVQLLPTMELNSLSVARFRSDWLQGGGGLPIQSLVSLVLPNHYGVFEYDGATWRLPWNPTFLYLYCGLAGLALAIAAAVRWRANRHTLPFALLTAAGALWMLGENTPVGLGGFRILPAAIKNAMYAEFALPLFAIGVAVLAGIGATLLRQRWRWPLALALAADLILVGSSRPMNTADLRKEPGVTREHYNGVREIPEKMRELVNRSTPPARIDTFNGPLVWANAAPLLEVPTANGNDPFALERVMQARLLFCKGERWGRYYQVAALDSPMLDLMNVRYILSSGPIDAGLLAGAGLSKVADLPGHVVYENAEVLPRFFLVSRIRAASGLAGVNLRSEAVVEGEAPPVEGGGEVKVLSYAPLRVDLEVNADARSFLVTSEAFYPGWRAWIDGVEVPLHVTNLAFRGLAVPQGRHAVTMRFEPRILPRCAALSAVAWIVWLVLVAQALMSATPRLVSALVAFGQTSR